jgi:hypothetical protein
MLHSKVSWQSNDDWYIVVELDLGELRQGHAGTFAAKARCRMEKESRARTVHSYWMRL